MDEGLRPAACQVATALRQAGHTVDVVLEAKKMKQVFKVSSIETTTPQTQSTPSCNCILSQRCEVLPYHIQDELQ